MNRRQRRAAAATSHTPPTMSSASEIPMARPPTPRSSKPKTKTLFEIAAEKQAELTPHGQPFAGDITSLRAETRQVTLTPDGVLTNGTPSGGQEGESSWLADDSPNPILDTLLLSLPLSSLHFTLAFLTHHQYAQQDTLSISALLKQTIFTALPTLTLLIHIFHGHALPSSRFRPAFRTALQTAQQVIYVISSNIAGCYLVYLTNDKGYFAVMKKAPAIGTLWVWCVIELGLLGALAGVIGPGIFAWWNGYGVL